MTKEELKEAIASTIVENGQKGITATALANLLNEIVDAAGEGGSGGAIAVSLDTDVDESTSYLLPNEERAAAYNEILNHLLSGTACSVVLCMLGVSATSMVTMMEETEDGDMNIVMSGILGFIDDTPLVFNCVLKPDGSAIL